MRGAEMRGAMMLALMVFLVSVAAAEVPSVLITFKQNYPGHEYLHENSFMFRQNQIVVTRSSNLFDPHSSKARLGFFQSSVGAKERYKEVTSFKDQYESRVSKLASWNQKLGLPEKDDTKKGHEFQYLLNQQNADFRSNESKWVEEFAEDVWLSPDLLAVDAVEVELQKDRRIRLVFLANGVKTSEKLFGLSELGCKAKDPKTWHCIIPSFGQVFLLVPAL
jgi:hypothetical protein